MIPVASAAKGARPSRAIGLAQSVVAGVTAVVLGLALVLAGSPGVAQAGEDPETTEEFEEVLIAELDAAGFDGQIATDGYMDAEAYVAFDGGEVFIHTWAAGDDVRRRPATLDGVTLLAGVPTQTGTWGVDGDPPIWTFSCGTKDYEVVGDGDLPLNSVEAFIIQFLGAQPCSSPVSLPAVSGPPAVFDGDAATVERIDEGDPILAAVAVSQARFPEAGRSGRVVIARVDVFADALAGAPLTAEAPLLFSEHDELPENSMAEIRRVATADAEIVILGGEHAISADIEEELAALGYATRRLAGPSRVETSVAIARVVDAMHPDVGGVAVARAEGTVQDPTAGWADSISGGAYATRAAIPIVLTPSDSLHPAVASLMEELRPTRTYVFGGTAAISDAVVSQLPSPARIAGTDRANTAAHTAALFGPDVERMIVVNGYQPDGWTFGLLAAGIARATHAPVVYGDVSRVPAATLERHQPRPGGAGIDTLLLGSEEQLDAGVAAALRAPLDEDEQVLLDAFVEFARTPSMPAPPPLQWAEEVSLHLADGPPSARFTPEEANGPVWTIEEEGFRGYTGPFNPLEQITQTTFPLTFGAGPHPHCASAPVPAPNGLESLRRLWVQPEGTTSCLQWFTVDLFINNDGAIAAVSMDLWEP